MIDPASPVPQHRRIVGLLASALAVLPAAGNAYAAPPIAAVVLKQAYGTGFNATITLRYDPVVLYIDGSYTTDAARALGADPPTAGRWRKTADGWQLTERNGKTALLPAKMAARPATPGATLSGDYRDLGGAGSAEYSAVAVAAWKTMRLAADGSVVFGQGAGAVSGRSEATTGPGRVVTYGKRSGSVRYRLDGWTITITHADGRSEKRLFYLFPDGDNAIGVGATTLAKRQGTRQRSGS